MNSIPVNELNSFKRLEWSFDRAYKRMLEKLYDFEDENTETTDSDQEEDDDESVVNGTQVDETDNNDRSTNDVDEEGNEYEEDVVEASNQDDTTFEPELISIALIFSKLMTKSLLNSERAAYLERQLHQMEQEICALRAVAKNCHHLSLALLCKDRSNKKTPARNKTDELVQLKESIRKEIDLILKAKNKELLAQRVKYKNKIYGLYLAIDYLKKELSGRVQQLQLCDKLFVTENDDEKKIEQYSNIWKQLNYEIVLNRNKTMMRMADNEKKGHVLSEEYSECSDSPDWYSTLLSGCQFTAPKMVDYSNMGHMIFASIYLEKDKPVGLMLIGGSEYNLPLVIWKICKDTVADKSGLFRECDIIQSIDKFDMVGASQEYAIRLIKSTSGWCRFGIVRIPFKDTDQYLRSLNMYNFELFHDDELGDRDFLVDNTTTESESLHNKQSGDSC